MYGNQHIYISSRSIAWAYLLVMKNKRKNNIYIDISMQVIHLNQQLVRKPWVPIPLKKKEKGMKLTSKRFWSSKMSVTGQVRIYLSDGNVKLEYILASRPALRVYISFHQRWRPQATLAPDSAWPVAEIESQFLSKYNDCKVIMVLSSTFTLNFFLVVDQ